MSRDPGPSDPSLRYGEFLSAVRVRQRLVSYNRVHEEGRSQARAPQLRLVDLHRLLTPYVSVRFLEQARAVVPLALFLALFQTAALRVAVREGDEIILGMLAVMLGLTLFMDGVKYGLMPFAENIGFKLPGRSPTAVVLAFAFLLGGIATFAEPAIGALRAAGAGLDPARTPWLHLLLTRYPDRLVFAVGAGVGAAVVLGMLRFIYAWRMKTLVIAVLLPCLAASVYAGLDPRLAPILGLAWDCGAVTTGPVTVPLVLALGIGVGAAAGDRDNPLSGFGIVTLASLFPAMAVILVAVGLVAEVPDPGALPALAEVGTAAAWWDQTPVAEMIGALRAIAPLVLLLWLAQRFLLGETLAQRQLIAYGVVTAVLGMSLFNVGLSIGLIPLGDQAGNVVPSAFHAAQGGTPLYPYAFGVGLTLLFAATIGYGATVAEPALNAMGVTVENLTDGAFPRKLLIRAVATGVAMGTALGVAKIIFQWPMLPLLLGAYAVALVCTVLSIDEYVSLAWDSAGVTTGPVTVPLVLALGLGLGKAVGAAEGFGILAMASAGPIISVLAVGLWIRRRSAAEH
ncbi:MAG: hypothetical protein A2V78_03690 [Betaproteobacteria bacterium RBG_16_64_18]|nr:MAG: hypothetical protein A2V78_03690 [Betaproteobacteria bacterium RBG_16_64_18]OGA16371.1 MAG: hypothetical protein A3H33_01110 [Betaproteobacteria bacterium RIFCSPLOWO2_02_FULL_65_20]OGA37411.1 MAG: hypothetical protein A3G26_05005 [Betaproteobacteria bacterium RIFCSPLOWO2_12_FULL_65_110]